MATEFISNSWLMPTNANAEANRVSNYSLDFVTSSIDSAATYLNEVSNFSISTWFTTDTVAGADKFLINIGSSSSELWGVQLYQGDLIVYGGSNIKYFRYNGHIATGQWYNLVVSYNGSESASDRYKVYLNGSLLSTSSISGTIDTLTPTFTTNLVIGKLAYSAAAYWNGKITEVSLFDYSLTSSQVTELYGTGSAIGNPMAITNGRKPVAYYPLGNAAFNGEFLASNGAEQDYVFDFDGTDDRIETSAPIITSGGFSFSCWFKTSDTVNPQVIWNGIDSTTAKSFLRITGTALRLKIIDGSGGNNNIDNTVTTADGNWHHIAFTTDGLTTTNGVIIYLDGAPLSTTGTLLNSGFASTTKNQIGSYAPDAYNFNGSLSNVSVFNTSLPATGTESVASLYNYGTPPNIASYSNLQAWWELDASATFDGSNWSIPDASSNSNTGTSSGMTAANLVQSDLIINAPYDSFALDFDGANDYINCGNNLNQSGSSAFSISTWVKYTSGSSICILAKANNGQPGYSLFSITSKIHFYISAGGTDYLEVKTSLSVNDGNWHNILITYDGSGNVSGAKIYIDGSLDTIEVTDSFTGSSSNTTNFQIGARGSTIDIPFLGKISNVSVFNLALSAAQVKTLYNEAKPFDLNTFAVTPVAWWRLGAVNSSFDGTNWTVLDEIGTSNGTSANMTQADLVDGVGATGSGTSSGMSSGTNKTGDAPYSSSNAVSYNMSVTAESTSVPT